MPTTGPGPTLSDSVNIDQSVIDEVVKAYYPAALDAATSARSRAQGAYTIASAIAAAIVAAGVFTDIDKAPQVTQNLGIAALGLWLAAAGLFMWAVAGAWRGLDAKEHTDPSSFVRAVLGNAARERRSVWLWTLVAQIITAVAVAVTFAAIATALLADAPKESKPKPERVALVLTPAGAKNVAALCKSRPQTRIRGLLQPPGLEDDIVAIKTDRRVCGKGVTIRLLKRDVLGVLKRG